MALRPSEKAPLWLRLLSAAAVCAALLVLLLGTYNASLTQLEYSRLTGVMLIALVFALQPDIYWDVLKGKTTLASAPKALNALFYSGVFMLVFSALAGLVLSGKL
ncbi:hypothetical protein [Rheinheimera sp.]|uniref:hypothetical protein n=1 Tax=Rheinheimera sp. TaxID=1869214 RepID=UPI00307F0FE0